MGRNVWRLPFAALIAMTAGCIVAQHDLQRGFRSPPSIARPHTWWHWMNGNITREGITADLEAMKQIGLGGAQIFNVSESIPEGPIRIMSAEWRELVHHAAREANRLGLELCMHNCPGWSSSGGPWIKPEFAMQTVASSETHVTGPAAFSEVLPEPESKQGYYREIAVLAFPTPDDDTSRIEDIKKKAGFEAQYGQQPQLDAFPPDSIIRRDAILDLSGKVDRNGKLAWSVPAGNWTILRFGYTPTGAVNAPSPESGRGLECDKLSRDGLDAHWAGLMGQVVHDLGPLAGKTLNNCLIDSYEVGGQNWTRRFREEFSKRRGYDPLYMLPTLTGRVVESGEISERFLWDLRRTIGDLFADNYYSYFSELCHKSGMWASIEPYDGPFECLLCGRDADIPMGEFWVGAGESNSCKLAASVAHIYGKPIIGSESFTAEPKVGRWLNHPASLKAIGDLMYCAGVNRYIIHRYAHQPWLDCFPGMTMGQWGTHFERTTTWWNHGGAEWVQYLSRCQFMLQQGRFVADACYFAGEEAPSGAPHRPDLKTKGYDYDACNADVLLHRASVKNGRLTLRDGMSYRVLVLPDTTFMTLALLSKLRDLVRGGATVVGRKPTRSPSLAGYPDCDVQVCTLADDVWGDCDGKAVGEHKYGAGRVIWPRAIHEILAEQGVRPDCRFASSTGSPRTAWIHRAVADGDIYFVSNQRSRADTIDCTFRVIGKIPELWHADSGLIESAPIWSTSEEGTTVRIQFEPSGSVFVVFRKNAGNTEHLVSVRTARERVVAIPKIEIRKATYEAVDGAGGADVTAKVEELVAAGETSIPGNNEQFGDPAENHAKRLRVDYVVDGEPATDSVDEGSVVELIPTAVVTMRLPDFMVTGTNRGTVELIALEPNQYLCKTSRGAERIIDVPSIPAATQIAGPWMVSFPPNRGAPPCVKLDKLISWTDHADDGVKYFSGTAEYETAIDISPELLSAGRALYLDLGHVGCIAEVALNGTSLGTWWKPPFDGDITRAARPGRNALKVRVTNLWVNRLIGDEQYPDDCEWTGITLKRWPQWFLDRVARPTPQRLTFTTWKHWNKDSKLLQSGLIGPVLLRPAARVAIEH